MKNINKPTENLIPMKRTVMDIYKELVLDKPQKISVLYDNECDIDSKQLYHQSMSNRIYGSSYLNGKLPASSMYGTSVKSIVYDENEVNVGKCAYTLIDRIERAYGSMDNVHINALPLFSEAAAIDWMTYQRHIIRFSCIYDVTPIPYDTFIAMALKLPNFSFKLSPEHMRVVSIFIGEKIKRHIIHRTWSYNFIIPLLEIIEDTPQPIPRVTRRNLGQNCSQIRNRIVDEPRGFKKDYIFNLN